MKRVMKGSSRVGEIVQPILDGILDKELAQCIWQSFNLEAKSLERIESVFLLLTRCRWDESELKRFFHAWRDTHLSSGSVSALVCRLLEDANNFGLPECLIAAHSISQVIHEDLGLVGETHAKLYERLANNTCASDEWKLDKYGILTTKDFSLWVHRQRTNASIEEALVTTIASEIYNHGEYTFIAPLFKNWLTQFYQFEEASVQTALAYILVHTGATESNHFLHGINALEHYLRGVKRPVNYAMVTAICRLYLTKLATAFEGIRMCLAEESCHTITQLDKCHRIWCLTGHFFKMRQCVVDTHTGCFFYFSEVIIASKAVINF